MVIPLPVGDVLPVTTTLLLVLITLLPMLALLALSLTLLPLIAVSLPVALSLVVRAAAFQTTFMAVLQPIALSLLTLIVLVRLVNRTSYHGCSASWCFCVFWVILKL